MTSAGAFSVEIVTFGKGSPRSLNRGEAISGFSTCNGGYFRSLYDHQKDCFRVLSDLKESAISETL